VRTHFCALVIRGDGGVRWPRKYGLNGTMPALTSSRVGSSATRLAEGTTRCPRSSKNARKRRATSADSISVAILVVVSGVVVDDRVTRLEHPAAGGQLGVRRSLVHADGLAQLLFTGTHLGTHVRDEMPQPLARTLPRGHRPRRDPLGGPRAGEPFDAAPDAVRHVHARARADREPEQPPHRRPLPEERACGCGRRESPRASPSRFPRALRTP